MGYTIASVPGCCSFSLFFSLSLSLVDSRTSRGEIEGIDEIIFGPNWELGG